MKEKQSPLLSFRFNLSELGGAFGDLGTLLPLAIALIAINGMNPTSVMALVGLFYIASGVYFRLPLPVQPLKAMSAIAIAQGLAPGIVTTAGLVMGLILLILSFTGAIRWLARIFPWPVVRGIQLGVGLILLKTAVQLILKPQLASGGPTTTWDTGGVVIPMGLLIAIGGIVLVLLLYRNNPVPASLALIILGLGISGSLGLFARLKGLELGFSLPIPHLPYPTELATAFFLLVIPQLPLTLGNAVVAAADTAKAYFGSAARRASHKALTGSMGLANLSAGVIGGMPMCHGSGGISAHYRFGARSGGSSLMIGGILLALALAVGKSLVVILSLIPFSILGVLLVFTGVQHAILVRDVKLWRDRAVVGMVGITGLAFNLALGFALGLGAFLALNYFRTPRRDWRGLFRDTPDK